MDPVERNAQILIESFAIITLADKLDQMDIYSIIEHEYLLDVLSKIEHTEQVLLALHDQIEIKDIMLIHQEFVYRMCQIDLHELVIILEMFERLNLLYLPMEYHEQSHAQ